MGMLFCVRWTLSPFVGRRWVPVHAETDLFKCQCEARPRSPHTPRARLFRDTEMSLATRSNQFRICMLCLDSGSNRFMESMSLYYLSVVVRFTLLFYFFNVLFVTVKTYQYLHTIITVHYVKINKSRFTLTLVFLFIKDCNTEIVSP